MKSLFKWLNSLRKSLWKVLSGGKVISAISHLILVLAGCLAPAYLAYAVLGKVFAVIAFHLCAEGWAIFMTSREMVDYMRKKAKAAAVEEMDETWLDGVGDLVGPYIVFAASWLGILWLIFGGG